MLYMYIMKRCLFLQKFKDPVFNYLIGVMKVAVDENQITVTVTALRDLCVRYGPDMFGPHKDYIVQRRDNEHSTSLQSHFTALIDQIEGRR